MRVPDRRPLAQYPRAWAADSSRISSNKTKGLIETGILFAYKIFYRDLDIIKRELPRRYHLGSHFIPHI